MLGYVGPQARICVFKKTEFVSTEKDITSKIAEFSSYGDGRLIINDFGDFVPEVDIG